VREFTFVDARTGWALGVATDGQTSVVYATADGGNTWSPDLTLPEGVHAGTMSLHGNVLTLVAGTGFVSPDITYLYERAVGRAAPPPVIPPSTGGGPMGAPPSSMGALYVAAAMLAAGLLTLAAAHRSRRACRFRPATSDRPTTH
jgi:hypothetical protein